jgi:hypothetical protein
MVVMPVTFSPHYDRPTVSERPTAVLLGSSEACTLMHPPAGSFEYSHEAESCRKHYYFELGPVSRQLGKEFGVLIFSGWIT